MTATLRDRLPAMLLGLVIVSAWEMVCRLGLVGPILLSPPSRILSTGFTAFAEGRFNTDIVVTLRAYFLALLLAGTVGTLLGVVAGISRPVFFAINPFVVGMNALPKVVLCPLVMLWFGTGGSARIFLGSLMALFPILASTLTGVQSVDRGHLMVARAYGASQRRILQSVVLPAIAPFVLSGLRVGVNYAMVGILIVEFFASSKGIGYRLYSYSQNFQTDLFFALMVFIVAFVLTCAALVHRAELHFGAWRDAAFK
jgi:NitT/TauT family transport system permease protein